MQTDRRKRDRVRLFFWIVLSVVCLVAVLVARQQQQQGLQRKVDAAQERAVRYTHNVLGPRLDARRVGEPIERSGYDNLLADVEHDLFNDQRVVRVRVWRPDGLLVFTTDDAASIGVESSDDADLASALHGTLVSDVRNEPVATDPSTNPVPMDLYATFIPLRASEKADVHGVVEIDNDYRLMLDATSQPWNQMQIAFGIVALLCLVMAILSFIWSHRPEEVAGFGPSRRDVRAAARDEKKAATAKAEAAKLRDRVKTLEGETKTAAQQRAELEALRTKVASFDERSTPSRAEIADRAEADQLKARAAQLEEQARGAEGRVAQLQARVNEMEAQLRVTTDQLRAAQKRAEAATSVPPEVQAQLQAASETRRSCGRSCCRHERRRRAPTRRVRRPSAATRRSQRRSRDRWIRCGRRPVWPRRSGNGSWPRPRRVPRTRPPCRRTRDLASGSWSNCSSVRTTSGRCSGRVAPRPSMRLATVSSRTNWLACANVWRLPRRERDPPTRPRPASIRA